jgi:hypothetical protein
MLSRKYEVLPAFFGLAAIIGASMIATTITTAYGHGHADDFKITSFEIKGRGVMTMYVEGVAGRTIPDHEDAENIIYAYVFVTDVGKYAVTSHMGEDSHQVEHDIEWHSHLVELDENNCVTSITDVGKAKLHKNRVSVLQTDATELYGVLTAELTASESGTCVTEIFDSHRT